MNMYLMYKTNTGEACWTGVTTRNIDEQNTDTHTAVSIQDYLAIDVSKVFVDAGIVKNKPTLLATFSSETINSDSIDTITLTNLPDPCTITYTSPGFTQTAEVTGGTATFTTDVTGMHTVKVVAFPYLDWEGTFYAV